MKRCSLLVVNIFLKLPQGTRFGREEESVAKLLVAERSAASDLSCKKAGLCALKHDKHGDKPFESWRSGEQSAIETWGKHVLLDHFSTRSCGQLLAAVQDFPVDLECHIGLANAGDSGASVLIDVSSIDVWPLVGLDSNQFGWRAEGLPNA